MTRKGKRLRKLVENPRERSFREISTILNDLGYRLTRINGSHHIFEIDDQNWINVPVHNGMVKRCYVKMIAGKIHKQQK